MVFSLAQRMNADRFWSTIEASAQTGVGREGGLSRSALSDADKTMRALFVRWCREAGLVVTVDAAGSIFGRRVGIDSNLAPVLIGSHLDTQANGGRLDGIAGVLAGLELVRTLNDAAMSPNDRSIVSWTSEEGQDFPRLWSPRAALPVSMRSIARTPDLQSNGTPRVALGALFANTSGDGLFRDSNLFFMM
jgi:N-carbamoyl-L-amino-acid hydrolase